MERTAWAKINLALHVTGRRADGYHLLQSLVTFAATGDRCGDRLRFSASGEDQFTMSGRFAEGLPTGTDAGGGNLVLLARDLLRSHLEALGRSAPQVHIHLDKTLPVASGIGGGSADAAAVLSGLNQLWDGGLSLTALKELGLTLGADLPMCLTGRPLFAGGIGEEIVPVANLPGFALVLVNPLVAVSTPAIFGSLASKTNPPLVLPEGALTFDGWIDALSGMRNDLEAPATGHAPEIGAVSSALSGQGARLVRMSGSGATCFGIFETAAEAEAAAGRLEAAHPGWYIAATETARGGA
ncbi:4-(cytidine 5'-diphospho)-2-C-methyl-D-erythritol kinase [Pararhizobium sp.]|uniref:4-(cytidine 5'-diphospho)-2-C-methyl-D-erythritol kinase n=1 Tax=Pararhizobium sp. TaxID=1977563 RepID=UPI002725F1E3|nr:4-(cytidine 5'-diphospho)-2-C-methyl-D-erythritol kinase [Pararhizobium sp.]MDO9415680.1 4-(cytidine 5'-diphospho)-2-C-methyl-D-erythritol kinase [Pararhizobium sp.]